MTHQKGSSLSGTLHSPLSIHTEVIGVGKTSENTDDQVWYCMETMYRTTDKRCAFIHCSSTY